MVDPVGFRFSPTDEEIVDHYLRYKNLDGNTNRVDEVISTVDIYSFDPWELPSLSRRESRDQVWYFFGCKKNNQNRGERQSRKTKSGFWKKTGVTTDIKRKRGEKIGEKRVLVFQSNPDWVMHEYVSTTFLSPNQTTYTVCKVIFKGDARDLSFSSSAPAAAEIENIHSQFQHVNNSGGSDGLQNPRQFSDFLDAEEEAQIDDAITRVISNLSTGDWNSLLNNDEEQRNLMFMQEDRSDYRPKMSVTGVFVGHSDDDSDSDLISATTCSIQTSSTCDSFCSSNRRMYQVKDHEESPSSTVELLSVTQEVNKPVGTSIDTSEKKMNPYDHAQGSEVGGDKMGQGMVIKNKRAGFLYRMMQKYTKKIKLCSSISRT